MECIARLINKRQGRTALDRFAPRQVEVLCFALNGACLYTHWYPTEGVLSVLAYGEAKRHRLSLFIPSIARNHAKPYETLFITNHRDIRLAIARNIRTDGGLLVPADFWLGCLQTAQCRF